MTFDLELSDRIHTLYRFYDRHSMLLYVGITGLGAHRWKQHSDDKAWWEGVSEAEVEHFPDRETLLAAEVVAIRTELPQYNTQHARELPASDARSGFDSAYWIDRKRVVSTCGWRGGVHVAIAQNIDMQDSPNSWRTDQELLDLIEWTSHLMSSWLAAHRPAERPHVIAPPGGHVGLCVPSEYETSAVAAFLALEMGRTQRPIRRLCAQLLKESFDRGWFIARGRGASRTGTESLATIGQDLRLLAHDVLNMPCDDEIRKEVDRRLGAPGATPGDIGRRAGDVARSIVPTITQRYRFLFSIAESLICSLPAEMRQAIEDQVDAEIRESGGAIMAADRLVHLAAKATEAIGAHFGGEWPSGTRAASGRTEA
jgi:hypothetical protein